MERAPGLKVTKENLSIAVIVLFHLVGLAGFYFHPLQPLFLKLVPYHLLLMLFIVSYNYEVFNFKFVGFIVLIAGIGYAVEWLGVNKQLFFGNYAYGGVLGLKLGNVPLMIGVNWFLLTYVVGVTLQQVRAHSIARIIAGAFTMVLLDVIIEPVAIKFNYWHWYCNETFFTAPLKNYLDWFLVSVAMLCMFQLFKFAKQNKVGTLLLASQFVFFLLMRWA